MKRIARALAVAIVLVAGGGVYVMFFRPAAGAPQVATLPITQGNVIQVVSATGTLAATRTVDVGTLVSGMVKKLDADFNSVVREGEVIAELDPATYQTQLNSAQAAVDKSKIDLASEENTLAYDTEQLTRERDLFAHNLVAASDVDDARVLVVQDQGQVNDDRAAITSAEAAVQQAQVNLTNCVIKSPVNGVVIARNVDEGQTVASSAAAPTLYVIATDLSTIDILGNIDEADVTNVRPGESVRFTVQTYPNVTFHGTVTEVRLSPTVTNDVVIYQAVIRAPNADLRLLPGMTANLLVEASESDGGPRVPNVALKFRPTGAVFAALHEAAPTASRLADGSGGQAPTDLPVPGAADTDLVRAPGAAGTVVDRLFAPGPPVDTAGQVWVFEHQQLRRIPVRLGVSDGTWTAIDKGDLTSGEAVVTGIIIPGVAAVLPAKPPK